MKHLLVVLGLCATTVMALPTLADDDSRMGKRLCQRTSRLLFFAFAAAVAVASSSKALAVDFKGCNLPDDTIATLRSIFDAHGLNWNQGGPRIIAFVGSESIASGIDDLEIATGLDSVMAHGFDLHDAEQIVSVFEEAAVSRSISLHQSLDALDEVLNGDSDAIVALDPHVRPLLAQHAHLSQLLAKIHHDYDGAFSKPSLRSAQAAEALKLRCPQ